MIPKGYEERRGVLWCGPSPVAFITAEGYLEPGHVYGIAPEHLLAVAEWIQGRKAR